MDRKMFGPLLLVVLIFGSMVSYGVLQLMNPQEEEPVETGPSPTETPEDRTEIAFFAEGVDANITELTELYPVYGFTDETNLASVVQGIAALESVERVFNPKFHAPQPDKERFMPFSAEIVPSRDSNIGDVMAEVQGRGVLSEFTSFRKAVVKIPISLELKSLRPDLNLSRKQDFDEPFAVCVVTPDAVIGDELKIKLYLKIAGNQVIRESMQGEMTQNISATAQQHEALLVSEVSRLGNALGFESQISYTGFEADALEEDLEGITAVEGAQLGISGLGNAFSAKTPLLGGEDRNALEKDLNAALAVIGGVKAVFFSQDQNVLEVRATFDTAMAYGAIRAEALEAFNSVLLERDFNFNDPSARLSGSIEFQEDANAVEVAFRVGEVFSAYNAGVKAWQDAFFEAESLEDRVSGQIFELPEGEREFPVRVDPGSEAGTSLNLAVLFKTIRGDVVSVSSQSAGARKPLPLGREERT